VKEFLKRKEKAKLTLKGSSKSLPNNFNHQIYRLDLPVLFAVRIFYWSNLPVLSMVRKKNTAKKVQLRFLTMKSTSKFDR